MFGPSWWINVHFKAEVEVMWGRKVLFFGWTLVFVFFFFLEECGHVRRAFLKPSANVPASNSNRRTAFLQAAMAALQRLCSSLTSWRVSDRWRCTPAHLLGSPAPREPAGGCSWAGCPGWSRSRWRPCRQPAQWWRPWGFPHTAGAALREEVM